VANHRKPEGEKFVLRPVRAHPSLWKRLDAAVPKGEHSAFIREAITEKLAATLDASASPRADSEE
jgi:hypothetical protein